MSFVDRIIRFFLENKLIAVLALRALVGWGVATAPFDWDVDLFPRDPVPVDAIPDISENQQIVFTEWEGRSPRDIEDQVTYPLKTELLGVPGVETIRGSSMFGFSMINIIFEEDVDYYWSRSRILEKLDALPAGTLPEGVEAQLGPDATAVGQVFWYTLQGVDDEGNPTGGWDPQELRSIQDFQVRYALSSVDGVAEVASIGGYEREYQVDIDPVAMREAGVNVKQIAETVQKSNQDIGARTLELNRAEYLVRGLGYIESLEDIEESVVDVRGGNTPIRIRDVANVSLGPAQRRGALSLEGAEAVGGVVTARHGENPLEVINDVKEEIERIEPGLPSKTLADGTESQVEVVPFYDRSGLIHETLGTLESALSQQILIAIIVIIIMVMHLRASFLVSAFLPIAVLMSFVMMRYIGVEANVVALAGIAISIGTVVAMGIIMVENMIRHRADAEPDEPTLEVIYRAATEVSPAVVTALLTTIVSFLPVFMLQAEEGRMFGPLAWTKTFILVATLLIVITLLPAFAHSLLSQKVGSRRWRYVLNGAMGVAGIVVAFAFMAWAGLTLMALAVSNIAAMVYEDRYKPWSTWVNNGIIALAVAWLLAGEWLPLGPANPLTVNMLFVLLTIGLVFLGFWLFLRYYEPMLRWVLQHRAAFLSLPIVIFLLGGLAWQGHSTIFGFVERGFNAVGVDIEDTRAWNAMDDRFPGLGEEFMPTLDEGSFLLMPTTLPHAGVEEAREMMQEMDMRVNSIPEVHTVAGKIGRAETSLDPAPMSMFETVVQYESEYKTDEQGQRIRFKVDDDGEFVRDEDGELIPDRSGQYYRQWRDHIQSPDDIWEEVARAADLPGVTAASKLHPIETRLIMLRTGMRADLGIRVEGPDLETIDEFAVQLEDEIRQAEGVRPPTVFADRVVGKPYLEIDIDREAIGRHGLTIQDVQDVINIAIGGRPLTMTVEGRERYPVRARYAREYRDSPEAMKRVLVPSANGDAQIPLGQLADINFETGPMNIRSENTFLSANVTFDGQDGYAPIEVVENVRDHLQDRIEEGALAVPEGISYEFEGEYQQQQRMAERMMVVVPITLLIIFLIMFLQFRSTPVTMILFSCIALLWAGGFIMLWLYGQDWFMDFSVLGMEFREMFQMGTINLSVAVWVGFLALFGIAVDTGVVLATHLEQLFERREPESLRGIAETAIEAGANRVRMCLMITGVTLLALLPIFTSPGKGSEIMVPMAVPMLGGMFVNLLTLLMVPLLYVMWREWTFNSAEAGGGEAP